MVELNQLRILQNNLHKNKERTYAVLNDPSIKDYAVLMLQEQYWSTYSMYHMNTATPLFYSLKAIF